MEGGAQVSSTPQQGAGGAGGAGGVVEEQAAKCPRCESTNTKFCYYNNYNLSQPRHFCKSCRRYWTKGGALRNVPIGGGSRKNNSKRTSPANNSSSSKRPSPISTEVPEHADSIFQPVLNIPEHHQMLDISGSFSSLLGSSTQLGSLMDFDDHHQPGGDDLGLSLECQQQQQQSSTDSSGNENFLSLQGTDWANGWPDLAIYTSPGNGFQ